MWGGIKKIVLYLQSEKFGTHFPVGFRTWFINPKCNFNGRLSFELLFEGIVVGDIMII